MRAVVFRRFGPPDSAEVVDLPDPQPAAGELLLRVEAFSVNPVDWKMMTGKHRLILRPRFPAIPCFDVCGVVEALGPGARGFAVGERVVCRPPGLKGGAAAQRIAVPATQSAHAPPRLDPAAAAALPLAGQTALQALREAEALSPGRRVCVIGASGGVGHFAVQIARAYGADVTGVCSARNAELVKRLGAAHVVDYAATPDARDWGRFDAVIDCVGAVRPGELRALTTTTGRVSLVAPEPHQLAALVLWPLVSKRRASLTMLKPSGADLALLCDLVVKGELEVVVDSVFEGLDALPRAFERSMTGRVVGKVSVTVSGVAGLARGS